MKARVTKAFRFAVDGNHVINVDVGAIVHGRCAEVALQQGWGVPPEAPQEEKASAAAPDNKALFRAPKNKGR